MKFRQFVKLWYKYWGGAPGVPFPIGYVVKHYDMPIALFVHEDDAEDWVNKVYSGDEATTIHKISS